MPSRPLFLYFVNRELELLKRERRSEADFIKHVKILSLSTAGHLVAPFAQFCEAFHKMRSAARLIEALHQIQRIQLLSPLPNFDQFIDNRRKLYSVSRANYGFYFAKKPLYKPLFEHSRDINTTDFIKRQITQITINKKKDNEFAYIDIDRLGANKDFVAGQLQDPNIAATFSIYMKSTLEPKPEEPIYFGELSTRLFIKHYASSLGLTVPTNCGYAEIEDWHLFPYYDLRVNHKIITALGMERLIGDETDTLALVTFESHRDFSDWCRARHRFLKFCVTVMQARDQSGASRNNALQVAQIITECTSRAALPEKFECVPIAASERIERIIREAANWGSEFMTAVKNDEAELAGRKRIVVLTVTQIESDAFVAQATIRGFTHVGITQRSEIAGSRYRKGFVEIIHVRAQMGSSGLGGSARTVEQAIKEFQPDDLLSVGICFGLQPEKQSLGDVACADAVWPYELSKLNEDSIEFRAESLPCHQGYASFARVAAPNFKDFKLLDGLFISGSKVINSTKMIDTLRKQKPRAIAGDMEGEGVAVAGYAGKCRVGVIKGICDWGYNKNDDTQQVAARNAFQVLFELIEAMQQH